MTVTTAATFTDEVGLGNFLHFSIYPAAYEIYSVSNIFSLSDPSWHPDGASIIFTETVRSNYMISSVTWGATPTHDVLFSSDMPIEDPNYSADGFFILFAEQTAPPDDTYTYGTWRLRYMSSDGSDVTTILDDGYANRHPVWITPTQIAFQWWSYGATPSDSYQIALIDLAGNGRIEMGQGEYPRVAMI